MTGWYLKSLNLQLRVVRNYYCTISFGVQMGEELMNFVLEVNEKRLLVCPILRQRKRAQTMKVISKSL